MAYYDLWNPRRLCLAKAPVELSAMLLMIAFLAGILLCLRFNAWGLALTTLVLTAALTFWHVAHGTPALQAFWIIIVQAVLLQVGYFSGLLITSAPSRLRGDRIVAVGQRSKIVELTNGADKLGLKPGVSEPKDK